MSQALDQFFRSIQSKAYAQAKQAVSNRDEALDVVQDSMLKLAKSYANRDSAEWPMLFQRILQNQIRDWYRRQKVRSIFFWWQQSTEDADADTGPELQDSNLRSPEELLEGQRVLGSIGSAVRALPARQQQVFLMRALWGHNTQETADILGCGAATVKTHYSRAVNTLKQSIEVSP